VCFSERETASCRITVGSGLIVIEIGKFTEIAVESREACRNIGV